MATSAWLLTLIFPNSATLNVRASLRQDSPAHPSWPFRIRPLDGFAQQWQCRSMIAVEEAVGKLRGLAPERSQHVLALIEDLAALQALEDKQDLQDARAALAEPGEDIPLAQLAKELGV